MTGQLARAAALRVDSSETAGLECLEDAGPAAEIDRAPWLVDRAPWLVDWARWLVDRALHCRAELVRSAPAVAAEAMAAAAERGLDWMRIDCESCRGGF